MERCILSIPGDLDPYFSELITAVGNWKVPILNYFEDPVTNAYTESVNSIIRDLDRVGRGYSFETMRALMLYDDTVRIKSTSTQSRRLQIPDDVIGFFDPENEDDDYGDLGFFGETKKTPDPRDLDRIVRRLALEPDGPDDTN